MSRTLIWNTSATAQTLPAAYGGGAVQPGYGWIVSDESSVAVAALGGFASMHSKWAVAAISSDEALGSVDMSAAGVALVADVVATIGGGGGGGGGGPVAWADVTNKPSFAAVATSGDYADLSNKPSFAAVASSGAYADLTGKPSIPVAGNTAATDVAATSAAGVQNTFARVDHQHAHGSQDGGSLHSAATTISAGFMSAADKSKLDSTPTSFFDGAYASLSGTPTLSTVATTGAYADLSGKPSLFSGSYNDLTDKPASFSADYNDLTNKPTLAAVATSGAYADLSGKPSLFSGAYADLSGKPALFSGAYADLTGKPTLATVATSGDAGDLLNQPYDFAINSPGGLVVNQVVMKMLAPRNFTMQTLAQGGGATIKIQVAGADVSFPKAVTAGQLVTAVVTVAGTDNYFTITGKI